MADLETVEKRIGRLEKKAKSGDKEVKAEMKSSFRKLNQHQKQINQQEVLN